MAISSSSGILNRLKFPVAQRLGPDSEMMNELPGVNSAIEHIQDLSRLSISKRPEN